MRPGYADATVSLVASDKERALERKCSKEYGMSEAIRKPIVFISCNEGDGLNRLV